MFWILRACYGWVKGMAWYGRQGVSRYLPSGGYLPSATKRLSFPRGDRIYIAMLSVKKDDNEKQNID